MLLIAIFVIVLMQVAFTWAVTSTNTPLIPAILGLVVAIIWLLWKEKAGTNAVLQRKRWNIILITSFLGVISYIVFAIIAANKDVSGLTSIAVIVYFFFVLPAIFGISGVLSRLLIR